jgi:hypothetical protein
MPGLESDLSNRFRQHSADQSAYTFLTFLSKTQLSQTHEKSSHPPS